MFIASVLAFCLGIYLRGIYSLPLPLLLLLTASLIACALYLCRRSRRAAAALALGAFVLIGALRLSFLEESRSALPIPSERTVFVGSVVESAPQLKILALGSPREVQGMRVAFLTGLDLSISDEVRLFGKIAELNPVFQNPGVSSWRLAKRIEGVHYQIKGDLLSVTAGKDWVGRMRRYFRRNIEKSGGLHQDILRALTIGDRTAIPPEKSQLFTKTGTSHVLAISGFNVGIISGVFFFLVRMALRRVRRWRLSGRDTRYAALVVIPFPFVFMLVSGAGVSVIRATIMTIIFMIALFLERQKDFYATTAAAALVILLIYPHSLFTPSFQLTFMSLLFIVMFGTRLFPILLRIRIRFFTWSVSTILSTIAATLGTAPIVVYYFYGINPACIIHNLFTIPLLGIGATVSALIGMIAPQAHHLLSLAGLLADLNIRMLKAMNFGYLYPVPRPTLSEVLIYYGALVAFLYLGKRRIATLLLLALIPLASIQAIATYNLRFNRDLVIHFMDVGTGDATLIEVPGGIRILVDGGGFPGSDFDVGRRIVTPFLLYRKIGRLDYVINTHPHGDHIGGLLSVVRDLSPSHLVTSGLFPGQPAFLELSNIAKERGIPHLLWKAGDGLQVGRFRLRVLHPPVHGERLENVNNASLVLRIDYGATSFVLPGDVDNEIEDRLALSCMPLRANVLKLAHHGSALSNGPSFLYAVRPDVIILSTGGSQRGLPGPGVDAMVRGLGIPFLRTDHHGLIEVRSDGAVIGWRTYGQNRERSALTSDIRAVRPSVSLCAEKPAAAQP